MNAEILKSFLLNNDENNSEYTSQNSNENINLEKKYCCFNNNDFCIWWFFHNSCNIIKNNEENNHIYCNCLNCCNDCLELRFNKLCNKEIIIYFFCCKLYYIK
jgi:hypothetical protein